MSVSLAEFTRYTAPDLLTRADVTVSRGTGFVTARAHGGYCVGLVTPDVNAAGQPIYRAQAGDVGAFAFKREDAVQTVLDLHNMQQKARSYDLLVKRIAA